MPAQEPSSPVRQRPEQSTGGRLAGSHEASEKAPQQSGEPSHASGAEGAAPPRSTAVIEAYSEALNSTKEQPRSSPGNHTSFPVPPGAQVVAPWTPGAQLGLDRRAYAARVSRADPGTGPASASQQTLPPVPGRHQAQLCLPLEWWETPPQRRRWARLRKALRCATPQTRGAVERCEPSEWTLVSCPNGHGRSRSPVPIDGCGKLDCEVCRPRAGGRRARTAAQRFVDAPILRITIPYPAGWRSRLDMSTIRAASPILWTVIEAWLRKVHHLDHRHQLASEDWLHPCGEDEEIWKPHHNFLIRGEALWLEPGDGGVVLRRRVLHPHVTVAELALLKQMVREVWERSSLDGVPEIPVVDYGYLTKAAHRGKRSHFIRYNARTFPGWHEGGRTHTRVAHALFQRGWGLYKQLLQLPRDRINCCSQCGAHLHVEKVATPDLPRRLRDRAPP